MIETFIMYNNTWSSNTIWGEEARTGNDDTGVKYGFNEWLSKLTANVECENLSDPGTPTKHDDETPLGIRA